jgi:hypothetical protein
MKAHRDERRLTSLAYRRPRAAGACRVSWRLATHQISYLYASIVYGRDSDGVVTTNGEVGISGYMV